MCAAKSEKLINDLEFLRKLSAMKVLVVDDQKNMVKTIENMLTGICAFKQKSHSLIRAYDGNEAVSALVNQPAAHTHHVDLVLLDWNMPGMPGIDVIKAIRNSKQEYVKNVPVIMITGESLMRDVNEALYSGVDNYLLKPFVQDNMRVRMVPLLRRYWSGLNIRRAQNRRTETRYPAEALKMKITVEFLDGSKKIANVINISNQSMRAELDRPESFETKCFYFPSMDGDGDNRCEGVSLVPTIDGSPKRIHLPFLMKYGFESPTAEKRWMEWVAAAKKNYAQFRGNTL
jgi:two-component system chemotaxis response regulator CheY